MKKIIKLFCLIISFCTFCSCNSKSTSDLIVNSFFKDSKLVVNIRCDGWFTGESAFFEKKDLSLLAITKEIEKNSKANYQVVKTSEKAIVIEQAVLNNKRRYYMICELEQANRFFAFDMGLNFSGVYNNEPNFCKTIFPYHFSDSLIKELLKVKDPSQFECKWGSDIKLNDEISIDDLKEFYLNSGEFETEEVANGFVIRKNDFLPTSLIFRAKGNTQDGRIVISINPAK